MSKPKHYSGGTFALCVICIITPFFSFIGSLFRMKNERNLWVIFFFYLVFGICFTINRETGFDSIRYVDFFNSLDSNNTLKEVYFANIINDGDVGDVYFPIVAWISKRITNDNYHIMFLLFASIFAIFTIKTLKLYYEVYKPKRTWVYSLTIALLIFNNFVFNINGMRFWTAAWIFAYGVLSYYTTKDRRSLIWIAITPLVHFTYIYTVIIFITSFFIGKAERSWITLLWLSIPFSFLSLQLIPYISAYIPDMYMGEFEFYTNTAYIKERSSGIGFTYLENFMRTCKMIVEAYVLYKVYVINKNNLNWEFRSLFQFTIVFVTLSNFLSAIPSMGRYIIVALPFVMIFVWTNINRQIFKKCLILLAVTMSFSILELLINKVLPTIPSDILYMNTISLISDHL